MSVKVISHQGEEFTWNVKTSGRRRLTQDFDWGEGFYQETDSEDPGLIHVLEFYFVVEDISYTYTLLQINSSDFYCVWVIS